MTEGSLVNRYRQYKAGTSKLVTWLAQTARKTCDITHILPSLRAATTAAKRANKAGEATAPDTNVKVNTAQMLSLTHIIVDAAQPVPAEILHTIRTVIEGRECCAEFYRSIHVSAVEEGAADDGHQYFIGVLKEILRLLETLLSYKAEETSSSHSAKPPAKPSLANANGLCNMFDLLQIEEPGSHPLGSTPQRSKTAVTFELDINSDEKTFAIWCLLQDYRDLHTERRSLWMNYKNGQIDYINVSALSSFALGIFRVAELELVHHHPDLASYGAILHHLGLEVSSAEEEVFISAKHEDKSQSVSRADFNTGDVAQLMCPRAYLILLGFTEVLGQQIGTAQIDATGNGYHHLRVHPYGTVLKSLLPRFAAFSVAKHDLRHNIYQLLNVLETLARSPMPQFPMWTVAAIQLQIDIHDLIGTTIDHEISIH